MDILESITTRETPQTEQADKRQVLNSAGGYTFKLEPLAQARRFLILGTDGGTYYTNAKDITVENAQVLLALIGAGKSKELVDLIVEVSTGGLAPKQNPAIFALAIASSKGTDADRSYALKQLSKVCRTGTHLFLFAKYVEQFRGWGKGLRNAVGSWYLDKPVDKLAFQAVKYRQRDGWTHRDLLRLAHPSTSETERKILFDWICGRIPAEAATSAYLPGIVTGYEHANTVGTNIPETVRGFNLPWEALPTESLNDPKVWEALIENGLPATALMRQLPRLTNLGLLPNMGGLTSQIAGELADPEKLKRGRVHPVSVLVAMKTYASGVGRGQSWVPTRKIVDALDAAFYAAFGAVTPMNKRTMLGLDVSGSMGSMISGLPISAREASAALAMVTAATEPEYEIFGFTSASGGWGRDTVFQPLDISPRQRMDDVIRSVFRLPFGATDCSLPMLYALEKGISVDTFIIYTDNETYAGRMHPHQALVKYREKSGIDAKLIVVGMTSTGFSIADPTDAGSLDVVGFDTSVPNLISDFGAGR
jgi:60 kDa SS-A/Ro ribonucleoprotein